MVGSKRPKRSWTDEELMALPTDGYKRELANGEIVSTKGDALHGMLISRFASVFGTYVQQHRLGALFDGQTGFRMKNRDVLCPDISFVEQARCEAVGIGDSFFEGAPDLAIEFVSKWESPKRLKHNLPQYFESGARLAWVMDIEKQTVAVHRGPKPDRILRGSQRLAGEELVPGFRTTVSSIFKDLP